MAERVDFHFAGNNDAANRVEQANGGVSGSNGVNAGGAGAETGTRDASSIPPVIKRRRGRPAAARDAEGNIIRDAYGDPVKADPGTGSPSKAAPRKGVGVADGTFRPNDRASVQAQIQGMHEALATLTKQPVFNLRPDESAAMTTALCNVLDYHKINLTEAGGAGGLYLALGLTLFIVYKPKLDYIKGGGMRNVTPAPGASPVSPATPGDASTGRPMMDFTADLDPPPAASTIM